MKRADCLYDSTHINRITHKSSLTTTQHRMKTTMTALLLLVALAANAQGLIKGKILDRQRNTPLEFVNMRLTTVDDTIKMVQGDVTDMTGQFHMVDLKPGTYILTAKMMGYRDVRRQVTITEKNPNANLLLYMREDAHLLR